MSNSSAGTKQCGARADNPASALEQQGELHLTVSNRMEALVDALAEQILQSDCWHYRHILVIPSPALKVWIEERLTARLKCIIGLEFSMLDELPEKLGLQGQRTALPIELGAHLERTLRSFAERGETFQQDTLQKEGIEQGAAEEGVLHPLARTLGYLFAQYGVFGEELVQHWSSSPSHQDWQQRLWTTLFQERPDCQPAVQRLALPIPPLPGVFVHLIGQSSLPKPQLRWIRRLAARCSVRAYQLAATPLWCADLRSGRELAGWKKKWASDGLSPQAQQNLEASILDDQPLLADWGRLSRRCQLLMEREWSSDQLDARFFGVARSANRLDETPPDVIDEDLPPTLLNQLQLDLMNLRVPHETLHLPADPSLQFHLCQSRDHEVEVLLNQITDYLHHHPDAQWQDLLIAAPQPERYRSLLRGALTARGLPLPLRWVDGGELTPLASWVDAVFGLIGARWSLLELGRVALHPCIGNLFGWCKEDYGTLQRFLNQLQIWWGWDGSQRETWLRAHLDEVLHPDGHTGRGTWSERLQHACLSALTDPAQTLMGPAEWPLFSQLLQVLLALEHFQESISRAALLTIVELAEALKNLLSSLDLEISHAEDPLLHVLKGICASQPLRQWPLPRTSASSWLRGSLLIRKGANQTEGIWVGSLQACRGIPARAIFLLGMDESSFPTPWNPEPFNRLPAHESFPSKGDYDRLCLIESLLGARERFILSATAPKAHYDLEGVSPTLAQLVSYMEKAFGVSPQKLITLHRRKWYRGPSAQPCLEACSSLIPPKPILQIQDLERALSRPLSLFLRAQLRWKRAAQSTSEPVELSSWHLHRLVEQKIQERSTLSSDPPSPLMPRGRLSEWVETEIQEILDSRFEEEPFTSLNGQEIYLSQNSQVPDDKQRVYPAVELPQTSTLLIGPLGMATGSTLWVSGDLAGRAGLRYLPQLAVWKLLEPSGVVASWKSGQTRRLENVDPLELLTLLHEWVHLASQQVLPLGPQLTLLGEGDLERLQWQQLVEELGLNQSWVAGSCSQQALDLIQRIEEAEARSRRADVPMASSTNSSNHAAGTEGEGNG